jgi:hypothetical protein
MQRHARGRPSSGTPRVSALQAGGHRFEGSTLPLSGRVGCHPDRRVDVDRVSLDVELFDDPLYTAAKRRASVCQA